MIYLIIITSRSYFKSELIFTEKRLNLSYPLINFFFRSHPLWEYWQITNELLMLKIEIWKTHYYEIVRNTQQKNWDIDQRRWVSWREAFFSVMQGLEVESTQARPVMHLENNSMKASATVLIPSTFRATQRSSISPLIRDLLPFGPLSISIKRIRHLLLTVKRTGGVGEERRTITSHFSTCFQKAFPLKRFLIIFLSSSQPSAGPAGPDQNTWNCLAVGI